LKIDKFAIYFAASIKSCWLIIPPAQTVVVYASSEQVKTFSNAELIDDVMSIQLPLKEIFEA
jgi:hypothetical protein